MPDCAQVADWRSRRWIGLAMESNARKAALLILESVSQSIGNGPLSSPGASCPVP